VKNLKSAIRAALPSPVLSAYREYVLSRASRRNARLSTEEVFTDIYANNRWGDEPAGGEFCSGAGSRDAAIVSPYVKRVRAELDRLGASSMKIVDLGCGDFAVGRQLASVCGHYLGIDIVKPLIAYNTKMFATPKISFRYVNIIEDELPDGDICFVRQVLQHLSNAEVLAVLPKLLKYRWCFVTEHHPSHDRLVQPNMDKPHGGDIRVTRGSGIFLEQSPFGVAVENYRLLLEVPGAGMEPGMDPGIIRTFLLENNASARSG
jgi:hypothetical protein